MALDRTTTFFIQIEKSNLGFTGTKQDDLPDVFRQIFPGRLDIKFVVGRQTREHAESKSITLVPTPNRPGTETEFRKGHDAFWIKESHMTNTITARTGPNGVVETEQTRLELRQAVTADRTGVAT